MSGIYQRLDSGRLQLRRLSLSPGDLHDPVCGTLETVSLGEHPKYEALSYVWGVDISPTPMVLDGTNVPITKNLDSALRHLRRGHGQLSRLLWVDAVCIDQSNAVERAEQVKLMDPIYRSASTVLVWLGPAADDSDVIMRSIQRFNKQHWQTYDFQVGFMEMMYRPWFTRIWVIQEFLLGKNPRIGCGNIWVPWVSFLYAWADAGVNDDAIAREYKKQFSEAVMETFQPPWLQQVAHPTSESKPTSSGLILSRLQDAFEENYPQLLGFDSESELLSNIEKDPTLWSARSDVMRYRQYESPTAKAYWKKLELRRVVPIQYHNFLWHSRGTLRNRKSLSFVSILKGTMNLRSTDPRDKVYGILGLVSDEARESIPVDYEIGPEWTFVPTMEHIIKHEPDGLAILGFLWRTRPFKLSIPSWVVDFTISADTADSHSPVLLRGSCTNASWKWAQDAQISNDHTTLSTSGLSFGKVKELVHFAEGDLQAYVKQFREIQSLVSRECPLSEPLWRTLIGVHNTGEAALDPEEPLRQHFEVLIGASDSETEFITPVAHAYKMFEDNILPIVRGRTFFVTDKGFAGISTPAVRQGDTIGFIFGMVRPSVLRPVDPGDIGVKMEVVEEGIQSRRQQQQKRSFPC
ncbi:heterokaryon incompatibility protein-domain-containing protein [Cadophora sp. MPI-SDFR-AT-0126]|nr:heterokaryon incompatibility protein-domain-containing protein [Leotiomycetes sp. MPI-SDFR-AT-0126]